MLGGYGLLDAARCLHEDCRPFADSAS